MSWDADLVDDRGHTEGSWNYTHNCNPMANVALFPKQAMMPEGHRTWWRVLDGKSGAEGAGLLHGIIGELERHPDEFRKLNPENGWGDFDSFLEVLRDMRGAVPEWPTTWRVQG